MRGFEADDRSVAAPQAFALATPVAHGTCDAPDCPAGATREVLLHGQDFRFCGHHWREHCDRLLITTLARTPQPGPTEPAYAWPGPRRIATGAR